MSSINDIQSDGEHTPDLPGLPALVGRPKQVTWAESIREQALALKWSDADALKLRSIVDATWWIANRYIISTMRYKEPAPHQVQGKVREILNKFDRATSTPHSSEFQATQDSASSTTTDRAGDALKFAQSVSRHPKTAEATILALFYRLYKPPLREIFLQHAEKAVQEADFEIQRDLDAVHRLLKV